MSQLIVSIRFVVRYAVLGLAIAFLIVALAPDWLPRKGLNVSAAAEGFAGAVERSAAAVVSIFSVRPATRGSEETLQQLISSLGSGVLVDPRGYIVTNLHVIQDAARIRIQLADGRVAEPRLVGSDSLTDLAVLQITLPDLPAITLGRSDILRIGDIVLAIGNPYGLGQTVTQGIVSATGRGLGLTLIEDYIQTDAAINVGNSGGALVNTRGELVGINIASLEPGLQPSGLGLPEGIGFAVPVNLARGVLAEIIEHGRVLRGWLGVQGVDVTPVEAEMLDLPGGGVLLTVIYPDSPAAHAGLRPGDVITRVNGERVMLREHALNRIARLKPGSEAVLEGFRDGAKLEARAVVVARPE